MTIYQFTAASTKHFPTKPALEWNMGKPDGKVALHQYTQLHHGFGQLTSQPHKCDTATLHCKSSLSLQYPKYLVPQCSPHLHSSCRASGLKPRTSTKISRASPNRKCRLSFSIKTLLFHRHGVIGTTWRLTI